MQQVGTQRRTRTSIKPRAFYDHAFFGEYPAITRNDFGKGTLTYAGTHLTDALQKKVLQEVYQLAGLTNSDQQLPAPLRVRHGTNGGKAHADRVAVRTLPYEVITPPHDH